MVTAHKAESKNEEILDKVRARAAVATDSVGGMAGLGKHIARLMAALTKAGQGSNPSSTPNSPQERGHGRAESVVALLIIQTPTMVEVALDKPPQPTAYLLGMGQGAMELG